MKETIQRHSKLIALVLGAANGIPGGFRLVNDARFHVQGSPSILPVLLFGLLIPPVLALLNNVLPLRSFKNFYRRVNSYVNLYMLIISAGLSHGVTGLLLIFLGNAPQGALFHTVFFASSGVGFLGAYFLDSTIGYRYEHMPNKAL